MPHRATGSATFLLTDVEGSTRLWERHPQAMKLAMARHDHILRAAIAASGGRIFRTAGDAFSAAFATAPAALTAALATQRALVQENWGELGAVRVRVALHDRDLLAATRRLSVPGEAALVAERLEQLCLFRLVLDVG